MKPLLISGCLLGLACRFDGKTKPLPKEQLDRLKQHFCLIPVCPEQLGGLPTPREPAEQTNYGIYNRLGINVTKEYIKGAKESLYLAQLFHCTAALLKERSPSCGHGWIYDGTFTKTLISGYGITARLLAKNGLQIYGESQIDILLKTT